MDIMIELMTRDTARTFPRFLEGFLKEERLKGLFYGPDNRGRRQIFILLDEGLMDHALTMLGNDQDILWFREFERIEPNFLKGVNHLLNQPGMAEEEKHWREDYEYRETFLPRNWW
ncbi:MAG: hypothetical protein AB1650_08080 [Candidatus Omnitrophota bacterium]